MTTREELTAGEVAAMLGWTQQAVIRAIQTGKLRARKIGREALIWLEDAKDFAAFRPKQSGMNS